MKDRETNCQYSNTNMYLLKLIRRVIVEKIPSLDLIPTVKKKISLVMSYNNIICEFLLTPVLCFTSFPDMFPVPRIHLSLDL